MRSRIGILVILGSGLFLGILIGLFIKDNSLFSKPDLATNAPSQHLQVGSTFIGKTAPDFIVTSLVGEDLSLLNYSGKIVLVNFWATWCAPCRLEMPIFEDQYKRDPEKFVIIGVNTGENADIVSRFQDELKLSFPIGIDTSGAVQAAYQVIGLPTSFIVDSKGVIVAHHIGPMTMDQLTGYLELLGVKN